MVLESDCQMLEITNAIAPADRETILEGLRQHIAKQGAPSPVSKPLAIMQRNAQGELEGGLEGKFFWDWLYVDLMWVKPDLRGHGLGGTLLTEAERQAQSEHCTGIYLWTADFNAPGFYEKMGYTRYVSLPDFPKGYARNGYYKLLATSGNQSPPGIGPDGNQGE